MNEARLRARIPCAPARCRPAAGTLGQPSAPGFQLGYKRQCGPVSVCSRRARPSWTAAFEEQQPDSGWGENQRAEPGGATAFSPSQQSRPAHGESAGGIARRSRADSGTPASMARARRGSIGSKRMRRPESTRPRLPALAVIPSVEGQLRKFVSPAFWNPHLVIDRPSPRRHPAGGRICPSTSGASTLPFADPVSRPTSPTGARMPATFAGSAPKRLGTVTPGGLARTS